MAKIDSSTPLASAPNFDVDNELDKLFFDWPTEEELEKEERYTEMLAQREKATEKLQLDYGIALAEAEGIARVERQLEKIQDTERSIRN